MSEFTPKPGEHCLLHENKVLYIGVGTGEFPHIFENKHGVLKRFAKLDDFEPVDEVYDKLLHTCIKDVQVTNCASMTEALKKLYDAGLLREK